MKANNFFIKGIFLLFSLLFIAACNNKEKPENYRETIVKKMLKEKYTEMELNSFNITDFEMSDRDFYNELIEYYIEWAQHKRRVGKSPTYYYGLADSILEYHLEGAKGNILFHKLMAVKTAPDTLHNSVFYFDNNDSLIHTIHYK